MFWNTAVLNIEKPCNYFRHLWLLTILKIEINLMFKLLRVNMCLLHVLSLRTSSPFCVASSQVFNQLGTLFIEGGVGGGVGRGFGGEGP